jgi:hypothetical protein
MVDTTYRGILERLEARGYDTSRLIETEQSPFEIVQSTGVGDINRAQQQPLGEQWL